MFCNFSDAFQTMSESIKTTDMDSMDQYSNSNCKNKNMFDVQGDIKKIAEINRDGSLELIDVSSNFQSGTPICELPQNDCDCVASPCHYDELSMFSDERDSTKKKIGKNEIKMRMSGNKKEQTKKEKSNDDNTKIVENKNKTKNIEMVENSDSNVIKETFKCLDIKSTYLRDSIVLILVGILILFLLDIICRISRRM